MHAVSLDPHGRVVICRFTGRVRIEERCEAIDEVLAQIDATGFTRILVDFTKATLAIEDVAELNRLARRLAQDPTLQRCRIAYVKPDTALWDPAVDMLAHGRGFHAERFSRREGALAWLT
jgi:hypothetical protein